MVLVISPEDRWEPWPVDIERSGGPERIYDDSPTEDKRRPVGFVQPTFAPGTAWLLPIETEPLLWEGDNA